MRRSRGENSFSKKTFTRVFENEFGPRERKPRKKKQSRFFSPRDYDQIKRITKRTSVESRFSVVECPRRFATSAIARLFLSPRSRWMPFPITLRFTPFSLSFLCFSLSVFSSFKFFVRLFLFCSFVALLSPSKISTLPFAQSHSTTAYTLLQRARDPKFLSDLFRS